MKGKCSRHGDGNHHSMCTFPDGFRSCDLSDCTDVPHEEGGLIDAEKTGNYGRIF